MGLFPEQWLEIEPSTGGLPCGKVEDGCRKI